MKRYVCLFGLVLILFGRPFIAAETAPGAQQGATTDNLILITLDGARTEEIFGGLDVDVLRSTLREGQKLEDHPTYRRFWAESPEARREKLLPFFWGVLMKSQGSIAGNRKLESSVRLSNGHHFSYPGYAEILLGEAHDQEIKSNDPLRNPFATVLEVIGERLRLRKEQVATFASWGVFSAIAEHREGATFINAGLKGFDSEDAQLRQLSKLQFETLTGWDSMRQDAYTFRFAMAHLQSARPHVMYLALGETDDWAHDGRYDQVLEAYARSDRYLKELWEWLEAQSEYRGRTHVLLTTDHGRGHTTKDWRDHNNKVTGADHVWIAFVSPCMTQRGEWRNHAPLSTNQIAATLAGWMRVDWNAIRPNAGKAIE